MEIKNKYLIGIVLVFLSCTFVYGQRIPKHQAISVFDQGVYRRLEAKIMAIDVTGEELIIAEKVVKLVTYLDKKRKIQYLTQFLDSSGGKIKISDFIIRDRVVVEGVRLPDGTIIAGSIIKLE